MPFLESLPDDATLLNVFQAFPDLSAIMLDYHERLMRGPSPFSRAERELIAGYVSGLNACNYCHGVHMSTAEAYGLDGVVLEKLMDDVDACDVDERMKPVLKYCRKLTEAPAKVVQADADAVFAAGWDETALYHAVCVCALFNFMNRQVDGLGIEASADYFKDASIRLRDIGYGAMAEKIRAGEGY